MKRQFRTGSAAPPSEEPPRQREGILAMAGGLLLDVQAPVNPLVFGGRALLWLLFAAWGWHFMAMDYRALEGGLPPINHSLLHAVNLAFHEAGHVIFRLFGDFMAVLGGSLNQLLIPALAAGTLLIRSRDNFGASIALWWLGQSLLDIAPYINDARAGRMLLLGGITGEDNPEYHDWSNLLGRLDLMVYDHALAGFTYGAGALTMVAALAWGALVLRRQYDHLDRF